MPKKPNILLILNDDMGYSDLGCYGGEIYTPNLDSLASQGLRYTQFYNTARCCPSRASLLTGLHPHQADVGHMMDCDDVDGYLGDLNPQTVTIAEALKSGGYKTCMSGKWHVTRFIEGPKHNWPCQRGFDDFYGIITGAANYFQPQTLTQNNDPIEPKSDNYYLTDVISDEAANRIRNHVAAYPTQPFFQYVAYTAPHWPLHAHPEDIARYKGRFDAGWDQLREERLQRMIEMGIIEKRWPLTQRDERVVPWENEPNKAWQARRMEVYAAQIDRMDQGIGKILKALKKTGQWENTLIVFLSDNGGCAEELTEHLQKWAVDNRIGTALARDGRKVQFGNNPNIIPGGEETYTSYGIPWANVSNTPFRLYKHWVHEGGIATPFIVHWPGGINNSGELRHQPAQLPDVMATFLDAANIDYPLKRGDQEIKPLEGFSLLPTFANEKHTREVLYWEHEGNKAISKGKWKLVCKHPGNWELYDIVADRTECNDISNENPEIVEELTLLYEKWAERCKIMEWGELCKLRQKNKAISNNDEVFH